jgi:hypothetical protein
VSTLSAEGPPASGRKARFLSLPRSLSCTPQAWYRRFFALPRGSYGRFAAEKESLRISAGISRSKDRAFSARDNARRGRSHCTRARLRGDDLRRGIATLRPRTVAKSQRADPACPRYETDKYAAE